MELNLSKTGDAYALQAYGDGGFTIGGQRYDGSVIVLPLNIIPWPIASHPISQADMNLETFQPVLEALLSARRDVTLVELLLVGCGERTLFIPPTIRDMFSAESIAVEPMDTGAACRSYNVMLADGRPVSAALLPV